MAALRRPSWGPMAASGWALAAVSTAWAIKAAGRDAHNRDRQAVIVEDS